MSTKDNGGAAFARPASTLSNPAEWHAAQAGMTLRDYFAGQALAGASLALKDAEHDDAADDEARGIAADAYRIADAMIAERSK